MVNFWMNLGHKITFTRPKSVAVSMFQNIMHVPFEVP